ncbi:DUF4097 family beta strand repeat-containing protein [Streptomyces sp. H27-C3]|uniref:DUF4097 family beta strand repeat-containing protein n=1 Tax=Streptomyces sp. H27-C3 TaxID=3046305 RepID=UPI0024B9A07A|nr:DUF4097 family beta strand repeat-containing protein [Streptomyces sp. H27-C3]MDJ0462909.1 DUF4097 family beta strand repeat-containing protein [Streptomyces sp. H27-C3]
MALRTRTLTAVGGVVVALVALSGCGGDDAKDAPAENRSFPFSGNTLTVDTDNSALELVPADVKDVEVTRRADGWVFLGEGPENSWKLKDGKLVLRQKCDALASDCDSWHRIKVPRGVAVTVLSDNGSVKATGFDTALKVRSSNGEVRVEDSSGALDLDSDNGRVVAEGISAKKVTADSENGAVRLSFSAVPDLVETVSDNGEIVIDLPRTGYNVTTSSDNGDVNVNVPRDDNSTHVVKARSDNGEVTLRSAN